VYARTAMTDHTGLAIRRQLHDCRAYVASHGWDLAGEFIDNGVSGASSSRPALNQMMDEVCAGRVQAVVVSRWTVLEDQSTLDTLLGDLDAHGVTVASVADGIESGGRAWLLQRQAHSRFNELESHELSEIGDEHRWSPDSQAEGIPRL
jgi:site-specific DNA recombinase